MNNEELTTFSLAKPTSGQWSLDDTSRDPRYARVVSDNGTIVAELTGMASTVAANGYLMAASKELLTALEYAVRWHDQLNPSDIARMKAAIAKAKATWSAA